MLVMTFCDFSLFSKKGVSHLESQSGENWDNNFKRKSVDMGLLSIISLTDEYSHFRHTHSYL